MSLAFKSNEGTGNSQAEFWRHHLAGSDGPLIHFLPPELLHSESVKSGAGQLGFAVFEVDGRKIQNIPSLMDAFAMAMNFPPYFGRNWDALHDCTTDLSWERAIGYTLVLFDADPLLDLEENGFSVLSGIIQETVRDWRDERGEYGERTGPVPFHVIFSGNVALQRALLGTIRESACIHESETTVRIVPVAARLRALADFRDCQRLMQGGAGVDTILSFMRERHMDKFNSAYALAALIGMPVSEAKAMVDKSLTWSDSSDTHFRNLARKALRDLGYE
jgi:RNAse (barnase) inhibitor barstar